MNYINDCEGDKIWGHLFVSFVKELFSAFILYIFSVEIKETINDSGKVTHNCPHIKLTGVATTAQEKATHLTSRYCLFSARINRRRYELKLMP